MTTESDIRSLAAEIYGIHGAIQIIPEGIHRAGLVNKMMSCVKTVQEIGGRVDAREGVLGMKVPVVHDEDGNEIPYDTGEMFRNLLIDGASGAFRPQ